LKAKTMNERFLKVRVPDALYGALLARAGAEGKRLGTHARDVLERDAQAVTTDEAITRIEAAITAAMTAAAVAAPVQPAVTDHELRRELTEVRLLLRELCMQTNAQIVGRVVAQLNAQAQPTPQTLSR
jgi:hypothetical protein